MVELTTKKIGQTKDGQDLYALTLKTKVDNKTGDVMVGLKAGDSIKVQKVFKGGFKNEKFEQPSFGCRVIYDDKLCSFFLNEQQHAEYEEVGGQDDEVIISAYTHEYTYNNEKKSTLRFKFELAQ